jgi:hypothetical protein
MASEPIQAPDLEHGELERRAGELYARYGALPWSRLPERTREHFRGLVRANIDGQGRPLQADAARPTVEDGQRPPARASRRQQT